MTTAGPRPTDRRSRLCDTKAVIGHRNLWLRTLDRLGRGFDS
ncbi:hypothetical protein ACFU6I_04075 [Streptomyces sp. NPDC057486]